MDIPAPTEHEEHTPDNPMYPEIVVKLSGTDGNVFALAGRVKSAMQKGGAERSDTKWFIDQLFQCGSYSEALGLMMTMVTVK